MTRSISHVVLFVDEKQRSSSCKQNSLFCLRFRRRSDARSDSANLRQIFECTLDHRYFARHLNISTKSLYTVVLSSSCDYRFISVMVSLSFVISSLLHRHRCLFRIIICLSLSPWKAAMGRSDSRSTRCAKSTKSVNSSDRCGAS